MLPAEPLSGETAEASRAQTATKFEGYQVVHNDGLRASCLAGKQFRGRFPLRAPVMLINRLEKFACIHAGLELFCEPINVLVSRQAVAQRRFLPAAEAVLGEPRLVLRLRHGPHA